MAGKSVLIVDQDQESSAQLPHVLVQEGYLVISASSGREALDRLHKFPDLVILDPHLPDMNGLDILRTIKQQPQWTDTSVLILSSKETEADEIVCLEIGADDYMVKPVHIPRLKARIHALFRRQDQGFSARERMADVITVDALSILIPQYSVVCGEARIEFSKREFEILVHLAKNRGKVITRQALFQTLWGRPDSSTNRTIDVHIGRIRKKLNGYARCIETVPGIGYRFQE